MAEASCLNPVIYRVDAATRAERPGQKRVVVDVESRRAVGADWYLPIASLKHFLVSTGAIARCTTSVIYVSDAGRGRAVGLKVEFEASCSEGNEDKVAEALCDDPNPGAALSRRIKEWVHEHINGQPAALFDSFPTAKAELESRIAERALDEAGLDMSAAISLCGEGEVAHRVDLEPLALPVSLTDYEGPLRVGLRLTLKTCAEDVVNAVAYQTNAVDLDELVRESARQFFAEKITLHQFYNLTDEVEAELTDHLDAALRVVGRRVETLIVERDQAPPASYEGQSEVEWRAHAAAEPIVVRDVVQMTVQDYASYLRAGSPALGTWLTENLRLAAEQMLYGKVYGDILLESESVAREIKNRLSFKASAAGCSIQQQLTVTSRSVEALLDGVTLTVEDYFETAFEGVRVKLRIVASAVFKRAEEAKRYVARGQDITKLMEARLRDEVRRVLFATHPERLCARPSAPEESGEEPLKALLGREVREALADGFGAETLSVSVELVDAEYVRRVNGLRREAIGLEAEVVSHSPLSKGPLLIYCDCRIEDLDRKGWEAVLSSGFDIEQIKTQLTNALKSAFETRDDFGAAYLTGEAAEKVKREIENVITDHALSEFGLHVKTLNVRREATEIEKKRRATELANERLRIETIGKLEQHVIQLIANNGKDEEIAQVQKRIAALKAYGEGAAPLPAAPDGLAQTGPRRHGAPESAHPFADDNDGRGTYSTAGD